MVFSSTTFLLAFLPLVAILYYICPRKLRNGLLLVFSLLFYGWGEPKYILIMLFSTVFDYCNGLAIGWFRRRQREKGAKGVLILSVMGNLAILGFFKYTDFAINNINGLLGTAIPALGLLLPIGISFYTFQTMSYTIDVYRGLVPPQRNIIDFGAYVTLFPQLIAGPILQYKTVAYDLEHRRENLAAATAWLGAIAYTFQIYFDFSGYSDMAIGLGHFFGFHFLENFNYPYESRSVTEFWRRWHISLSTWFREYVYIPLGGNRKGKGRQLVNIAIVWLLTGLWHGASWNFVLWGVYYAVLLLLEKTFLLKWLDKAPRFVGHVYTCLCFVLGWVLFAITDFSALGAYLGHMFSGAFADGTTAYLLRCDWLVLALAVVGCTSLPRRLWEKRERAMTPALSDGLRTVWVAVVLLVSIAFLVGDSYNPFLYFRF